MALIEALAFDLREVLVPCDLEGSAAAGRTMGLDDATVGVRLHAARTALGRRVVRHLGASAA